MAVGPAGGELRGGEQLVVAEKKDVPGPGAGTPITEVIEQGILRAVFQPIIDLHSDRPIGWEALARVGDDDEGFDQWLASADEAGLGIEFQVSALHAIGAAGRPPDDTLLFVNVRPDFLGDPRFLEECERLGPRVAIDVRGSDIEALNEVGPSLDALAHAGVHLSIDDTTAASLAMIARVRPSFIKLDPQVVRDLAHDPVPRSVVAAYLAFAETDGIHVVAEGVERYEQLDVLRDLGVRFAQGHLFGLPTADWTRPAARRLRPPLELDSTREVSNRFALAHDVQAVAEVACAELRARDLLPSFYLEREGMLRCLAQFGYWQILDGIPVRTGVMAKAFRSGRTVVVTPDETDEFIEAVPGIVGEIAVPIRVGRRTIGVLNVEATRAFDDSDAAEVELVALALEQRLEEVGVALPDTALHRLARANNELSSLTDATHIELACTRLACEISAYSSALLAMPGAQGLPERTAVQGPLASELSSVPAVSLGELGRDLADISSSMSTGDDEGLSKPAMTLLRQAGASSIAAFPVRSTELGHGLLILADHAPLELELEEREAIELLAREVGRSLDMAVVMADLRARATRDTLTGLGNKAAFDEALTAIGGRRKSRWAVAMADVDGFKRVNDTYGHLTGDRILRELAGAVDTVLRAEDRMYRVGGDEFAAILHDVDAEGAEEIGQRMCEAAESVMGEFDAGLSIGIALPAPYEQASEFLERADQMLYEVKREARGTARVAQPEQGTDS